MGGWLTMKRALRGLAFLAVLLFAQQTAAQPAQTQPNIANILTACGTLVPSVSSGVGNPAICAGSAPPFGALSGSVIRVWGGNSATARSEIGAIAGAAHFSGVRIDGTAGSPSALASGDAISSFNAWGAVDSATIAGPYAAFRCYAAQNWTANGSHVATAAGTYCDVAVTPNNGTTLTESVRFENDGGVTLPSTVMGGDKGAGTINGAGFYVNGVAVPTAPVGGAYGGTGLTTAAVGDLMYASATTPTWSRLADVAVGSVLVSGGVNTAPKYATYARSSSVPSNTSTNSTSYVMGGFAGSFTPAVTGNALWLLNMDVANSAAGICSGFVTYGTGTAPVAGAAYASTTAVTPTMNTATNATLYVPFVFNAYVTGLTVGTTYWYDLAYTVTSGASATCSLSAIKVIALEQ
jgi:hypothetical protein